ncbi:putative mitochondrial protein [Cucumis melo var. makuwa]|uniref:Mitochondrial protein n=1 Tax=Cucumis melo var. makuwa TaxID=1194695 RepID=A0A5D3BVB1_CUCMM|nr:putative mitochondrial protein [Cucumis melo var. makuwa]TYK03124.1 putative mitochondrial protein [Cucumis melo var. makuwa]
MITSIVHFHFFSGILAVTNRRIRIVCLLHHSISGSASSAKLELLPLMASLSLMTDGDDELANPNIIYKEPDDEASFSDKEVSDATGKNQSIVIFRFGQVVEAKERCFPSVKSRYRPPCSSSPLTKE